MKIIVISSSNNIEDETKIVTQLFEAGLETFHLRKHKFSTRKMKEYIAGIPAHFHNRIVIHSHHKLAIKFNLKGIHLTKYHKKRKIKTWLSLKLIQLRKPGISISTSFNNTGQLFELHKYKYNYVFLSPIFDSLSGKFQGGFTEHSLKSALQKTTLNIIARGGIDHTIIAHSNNIGFYGVAFYSFIWKKKHPLEEFNKIVEKFNALNISIE